MLIEIVVKRPDGGGAFLRGNDHAVVVIGYNSEVAVIRDVLGPTDTNWGRPFEYEVPWETFLRCRAAQGSDGLAIGVD